MEDLLREYFERKHRDLDQSKVSHGLPVVTLSREYGCPSKLIARLLADAINRRLKTPLQVPWKFISKEIMEEAAKDLQMKTVELNYLLSSGNKGLLEDILTSFTPVYASNIKLKKTLVRVVKGLAARGNVIMVGRGSSAILQGIPGTFHVRLQAPVEWRIREVSRVKNIPASEAANLVSSTDRKRTELIEMVFGKRFSMEIFDLVINCERFTVDQIVELMLKAILLKRIID